MSRDHALHSRLVRESVHQGIKDEACFDGGCRQGGGAVFQLALRAMGSVGISQRFAQIFPVFRRIEPNRGRFMITRPGRMSST